MKDITCALTIAGTDPTGGAGIQADLKTFQELQTYGMSIVTSVVAQNTTGVQAIEHISLDMIEQQLDSVFSDVPVDAVKTGMIANIDMMKIIKKNLDGKNLPLVIDPVMVATSGDPLINEEARDFLRDELLAYATVVTPNLPEAEFLTNMTISTFNDMKKAAEKIVHTYGAKAALVKGGHLSKDNDATDFLYDGNDMHVFTKKRIDTKDTHGTGCTYSAAITAHLAQGLSLYEAVEKGKEFIQAAIEESIPLGAGSGPTKHWAIRGRQV